MTSPTRQIARWVASASIDDIPDEVLQKAKLHILDTLGCAIAAHSTDFGEAIRESAFAYSFAGPTTVIGLGQSFSAIRSAFVNGALAHAMDFDDTHPASSCHVSAVSLPSALAMGEHEGLTGRDLLLAYIVGVEVIAKIGSVTPGAFHRRGFHPTSVVGVFGSAVAAASILGAAEDLITDALGIAGSFASGTFSFLSNGATVKPIHAGNAARAGIEALNLALAGVTGPEDILDGPAGLFSVYLDSQGADFTLLDGLGTVWETLTLGIKPYASCHATHSAIEAVRELQAEHDFDWRSIAEVRAFVRERDIPLVVEPYGEKTRPTTVPGARFSLPYVLASTLIDGQLTESAFTDEAVVDPRLHGLMDRFTWEVADFEDSDRRFPGGVSIKLANGTEFNRVIPDEPGSILNPLARERILEKFLQNTVPALGEERAGRLQEAVFDLESLGSVRELMALMSGFSLSNGN